MSLAEASGQLQVDTPPGNTPPQSHSGATTKYPDGAQKIYGGFGFISFDDLLILL